MGKMKQMLLEEEERMESIHPEDMPSDRRNDMPCSLKDMLDGEHRKEILAILLDSGSRMNWRRDDLRRFFKARNINCKFTMAELRAVMIQEIGFY